MLTRQEEVENEEPMVNAMAARGKSQRSSLTALPTSAPVKRCKPRESKSQAPTAVKAVPARHINDEIDELLSSDDNAEATIDPHAILADLDDILR